MNREKAIEAMDALVAEGYAVQLTVHAARPEPVYSIDVSSGMSIDTIDMKMLAEIADELGLDIHARGALTFKEPDRRPESIKTGGRHLR